MDTEIFNMLKEGEIEGALKSMAIVNNNARLVLADYKNEKMLLDAGLIDQTTFDDYHEKIIGRILNLPDEPDDLIKTDFIEIASVFLSYNHEDLPIAYKIQEELSKHSIKVRFDQSVDPGQSIQDFIFQQARNNQAFMLLLSENSLKSSWVIYEGTIALFDELLSKRQMIPVSIDNAYESDEFSIRAFKELDSKIKEKEKHLQSLKDINADARHIHKDLDRLNDARNNLSTILLKLRGIAVFSIAEAYFEKNLGRIANNLLERKNSI